MSNINPMTDLEIAIESTITDYNNAENSSNDFIAYAVAKFFKEAMQNKEVNKYWDKYTFDLYQKLKVCGYESLNTFEKNLLDNLMTNITDNGCNNNE